MFQIARKNLFLLTQIGQLPEPTVRIPRFFYMFAFSFPFNMSIKKF